MTDASGGSADVAHANPLLRRLGFGPRDRAVILQADDIGMCEATIAALPALADSLLVTSTSVMVSATAPSDVVRTNTLPSSHLAKATVFFP